MGVVPKVGPVQKFSQLRFYSDEDHWNGRTYKRFRIVIQDSTYIEHCIIRETLFITSSPPILGAFITITKILCLLILNRLFLNNVKMMTRSDSVSLLERDPRLTHIDSREEVFPIIFIMQKMLLFVDKRLRNEGIMYWRSVQVFSGLCYLEW